MMRLIGTYIVWGGAGLITGLLLAALLFMAIGAIAHADDAVRPARLGEQDRSLNYKSPGVTHTEEIVYVYDTPMPPGRDCATWNHTLVAKIRMIARSIARDPENGHFYYGAIVTIWGMWCTDG